MPYPLERLLTLVFTASFSTLASAQAGSQPVDNGFFRPAADPNLTAPKPNEKTRPTEALTAEDKVQAAQGEVASDRAPDPVKVMRWTEQQMDRSEQEAAKAKPEPGTPQPINGAFTGLTNDRDR